MLDRLRRLRHRSYEPEILDRPGLDRRVLARAYRFMAMVNRYLGGHAALRPFMRPGTRCLDVGCGGGDALVAAVRTGASLVVGVEISREVLALACRWSRGPRVRLVRADGRRLPFAAGAFDAAWSSLVFHHLDESSAARFLAEQARVARVAIVNDLRRDPRAFLWAWIGTALLGDPVARVDGPRSVERAFTPGEALEVARAAGLDARAAVRFGHRLVVVATAPDRAEGGSRRCRFRIPRP